MIIIINNNMHMTSMNMKSMEGRTEHHNDVGHIIQVKAMNHFKGILFCLRHTIVSVRILVIVAPGPNQLPCHHHSRPRSFFFS